MTLNSYFRVPNGVTIPPDGRLQIGHIITHPKTVLSPLNMRTHRRVPESILETLEHGSLQFFATRTRGLHIGLPKVIEYFFEMIKTVVEFFFEEINKVDINFKNSHTTVMSCTHEEAKKYIKESLELENTKKFMEKHKKPVYLISGLVIGREFYLSTGSNEHTQITIDPGIPVGALAKSGTENKSSSSVDMVFAFQLRKITRKGNEVLISEEDEIIEHFRGAVGLTSVH